MIERFWMIASVTLLALAAFFVWRNNLSAAFVTAALGACAWFLRYRAELKKNFDDDDDDSNPEQLSEGDNDH